MISMCMSSFREKLCQVEEHRHQLAHQCSPNIIGIWEWGICGLMGGAFITFNGWSIYGLLGWTFMSKYYEYTVAKQNGGGAEWVELFTTLTKGMGEPTYGLLLSLIASWRSKLFSASCIEGSSLDTRWILGACSAATLSR